MGLRASSPSGPSVSWLVSPSPVPVHELAHCLGAQLLGLGGREHPRQGLAGTLGCGRSSSFWLVSDLKVSANLDFRKHHRGPQAPEVAVKAGLCPDKELWFEESRCPVERIWMGRTLQGPDADAQLQTQRIVQCTGVGSLKQHHGGGGGGMNIQTAT